MDHITKALVNTINSIVNTPICESCEQQKALLNEHGCYAVTRSEEELKACLQGVHSQALKDAQARRVKVSAAETEGIRKLLRNRKKTAPTPGKTPYDDRAGDTSIDAANDPARGGQSGAWGGGAGTPAPERKPPTFDQDFMDSIGLRLEKSRKPSPYDIYYGPGGKPKRSDGLRI